MVVYLLCIFDFSVAFFYTKCITILFFLCFPSFCYYFLLLFAFILAIKVILFAVSIRTSSFRRLVNIGSKEEIMSLKTVTSYFSNLTLELVSEVAKMLRKNEDTIIFWGFTILYSNSLEYNALSFLLLHIWAPKKKKNRAKYERQISRNLTCWAFEQALVLWLVKLLFKPA